MTSKPQLALILTSVSTPEQAADSKQSLDTQERDLRAVAAQRGWQVLDVLRIPGFSRDYISWEECAQDMLKQGITALSDLKRYCDEKAFDVFMVRDADRFGRTQSLIMQIAETICIRHRLKIFSQIDNTLVEGEAARFWAAMTGLRSAGEMDKKRLYHHNGMERRAENGFHETNTPWFHRTIHDPDTGQAQRVEVREEYRYIWDAVYKALVEDRISFVRLENVLFEKYQIVSPLTGKPFASRTIYNILCVMPAAWGHRVRGLRTYRLEHGRQSPYGEWVYDPAVPPPPGIKLYYHVFDPIYTGQQADNVRDELRRRTSISGGSRTTHPSTFSGLVVCDYCDAHIPYVSRNNNTWRVYRCQTHDKFAFTGHDCAAQIKLIHFSTLTEWLTHFLEDLLSGTPFDAAFPSERSSVEAEIAAVQQNLEAVTVEKTNLIERLGLIPESMLQDYQTRMRAVAERAEALNARLLHLRQQHKSQDQSGQMRALQDIDQIGLDAFFALEEGRQQQMLKRLFGQWRILVADGAVVGVAIAGLRPGSKPRRYPQPN